MKTAGICYNPKDKGPREDRCYWSQGPTLGLSNGIWSHRGDTAEIPTGDKERKKHHGLALPPAFQSPISCSLSAAVGAWNPWSADGEQGMGLRPDRPRWPRSFIQFLSHLTAQKWDDSVSLSPVSRGKWAYVFANATKMMTDGGTWQWILKGGQV